MTLPINVEDRLSFLVRIPGHEGEEGISRALLNDKKITKENPEEILGIASSRYISEIQVKWIKIISATPSATLSAISSELVIIIDQTLYQRKLMESKGVFLCRKGATKKGTLGISNLLNNHIMAF